QISTGPCYMWTVKNASDMRYARNGAEHKACQQSTEKNRSPLPSCHVGYSLVLLSVRPFTNQKERCPRKGMGKVGAWSLGTLLESQHPLTQSFRAPHAAVSCIAPKDLPHEFLGRPIIDAPVRD